MKRSETRVPKFILKKLQKIQYHQLEIKRILDEIDCWKPEILENYVDVDNKWLFRLWIDRQGDVMRVDNMAMILSEYINKRSGVTKLK